jgi:hypothetical protein
LMICVLFGAVLLLGIAKKATSHKKGYSAMHCQH